MDALSLMLDGFGGDLISVITRGEFLEITVVLPDSPFPLHLKYPVSKPTLSSDIAITPDVFFTKVNVVVWYADKKYEKVLITNGIKAAASVLTIDVTDEDAVPSVSINYEGQTWTA